VAGRHPQAVVTDAVRRGAWAWVPSLYFAQAVPYVLAMTLSVVFYKRMAVSNTDIALYTSWLYLPWVIKPLWSPMVELLGRKRHWIVGMQGVTGFALALVALSVPMPAFFQWTLALFWLMAFASATHDIAADGFYMLALGERTQTAFVGVRSVFYRLATIAVQGGFVMLAGAMEQRLGDTATAWLIVFSAAAALMIALALLHLFVLPSPRADRSRGTDGSGVGLRDAVQVFAAFFQRPDIGHVLAFLLLYRLGEAQLLKLVVPFLLDPPAAGGLGLTTQMLGWVYGTIGTVCLLAGGVLGGWVVSRGGLQRWIWPMVITMHAPNLLFVALAGDRLGLGPGPVPLPLVAAAVALEQFGYGFGFTAFLVFMLWVAGGTDGRNPHRTAHYALCTGFMALGMMLPGMWSGWLQQQLGYLGFFVVVCVATLPSLLAVARTRIDPDFGRRERSPD
jgi:PAT family beta-lactamase induction signal transducer AmpG